MSPIYKSVYSLGRVALLVFLAGQPAIGMADASIVQPGAPM
jgi:hypothetical protein